jgi:hypothetical protein
MHKGKIWPLIAGAGLAVTSLVLVFLLLGRSAAGATPEGDGAVPDVHSPDPTFTISGIVTCEAITGPIDVEVFIWPRDGSGGFTDVFTDSGGHYSVTLEAGAYDLLFHPPCGRGCASEAHKGITGPPDVTLNATLSSGHTISGTVTDGTNPVRDVSIYAFHHETASGFGLTLTNGSGHYCIGLITGTYDLGFTPPPCWELGPKTVVTNVNHTMSLDVILPAGFTVAGRVTDEADDQVSGAQIYARECYTWRGYGFSPSNANGYYTGTLPLESFGIQFLPPASQGLGPHTVTDVVSTTAGCPNTSLDVTLPAGYTISGRVTCQGKPAKNTRVHADPAGPSPNCYGLDEVGTYTLDDGSYNLPLVSGTYRLEFTPASATGLNAKAFTTTEVVTDTVLDVDFCVCSGVWVTETVDSVGDTGFSPSLALAPTHPHTPQISYYNVTSRSLKYAWLSGTIWLSQTVDSGDGWTKLALVSTYPHIPCILYRTTGQVIKFAYLDGTTWISKAISGGYAAEKPASLALERGVPHNPHICYYMPFGAYELRHLYLSGTAWMSGTWMQETVERFAGSCSIALEQTPPYTPYTGYVRDGSLKYAWKDGTTWISKTVDSSVAVRSTSLAVDMSGHPHIGYYDLTNRDLKYAWSSGTTWLSVTVDGEGDVGDWPSIALDCCDNPHISYYDRSNSNLKYARFDGRVWIVQTVDSEGSTGGWPSLALDQAGCPHISYHYDGINEDLKYAYIPIHLVYLPLMMRGYH